MQKKKQPRKHSAAASLCITFLLCVLSAEGVMLVRQAFRGENRPIHAVQSPRETDAKLEYLAHFRNTEPPARITAALNAELDTAYADYLAGQTAYADTADTIRAIRAFGIGAVTAHADSLLTAAKKTENARQAFSAAQKAAQRQDYAEAVRQYRLVTDDAPDCAPAAKDALPDAEAKLREQALAAAAEQDASADYDAEIAELEQALAVLPDDSALLAAKQQAAEKRADTLRHTAMQNARTAADLGRFSDAFAALTQGLADLPEDELLQFAQQNLRTRYLLFVQEETAALADQGRTAEAGSLLTEAERLLPGEPLLQTVRQNLTAYQPQKLSALTAGSFNEFFTAEQTLRDNSGKEYPADGNLFYSYDGALTGRRISSADFTVDGQYDTLTLTAAPLASYSAEHGVMLEIYGDNKLLRACPFDKDSAAITLTADITGVKTVKLRITPSGMPDLQHAGLLITNGSVRKTGRS